MPMSTKSRHLRRRFFSLGTSVATTAISVTVPSVKAICLQWQVRLAHCLHRLSNILDGQFRLRYHGFVLFGSLMTFSYLHSTTKQDFSSSRYYPFTPNRELLYPRPPKVPVPRLRAGTLKPEPPSCRYSIKKMLLCCDDSICCAAWVARFEATNEAITSRLAQH